MPKEAPFISKTLRLVSLALILATVAIAGMAAYSGYEEYGALTKSVGTTSQLNASLNGSDLVLSGLTVPNKMTFPLSLELLGNVTMDNATIGKFDSGTYLIQPNESQAVNVTVPVSFAALLNNPNSLSQAAFNSSEISITTTLSAHVVPLLGINLTRSANSTVGPVFGDLSASLNLTGAQPSSNSKDYNVPLILTWENSSPLSDGAVWFSANVTSTSVEDLGSTSGFLNFTEGQNRQIFPVTIPASEFRSGSFGGTNYLEISLSQSQFSPPFAKISRPVSV
jgi:hypothetical protein